MRKHILFLFLPLFFIISSANAQCPCDCPYPVLFIHGLVSNSDTWNTFTDNVYFKNVWGAKADVFHAAPNAQVTTKIEGADGLIGTADDDVKWIFTNENNVLAPGCIYAMNFDVRVNSDGSMTNQPSIGGSPSAFDADNNESAIIKQGYAVSKAIQAILVANPTKKKVILVGHSMGGLASREYLQRTVNNNATSAKRWWVNPAQADGHKVAKLLTLGTPHLGSNTGGNISSLRTSYNPQEEINNTSTHRQMQNATSQLPANEPVIDNSLIDLASEAIRDLRYSYDNINIFQNDYPGVYLFGGKESDIPSFPYAYWNVDVNGNGLTDNTVQVGINQNGQSIGKPYQWDGTKDNPNMPLPTNVRYTYYISNTLSGGSYAGGDLVVDDQRQWLYQNGTGTGTGTAAGIPVPHDGTNYRLSDRILLQGGPNHLGETADVENIVRGLDEGDYPIFAHDINTNVKYAGMAQIRATEVAEGANTTDADWFKFTLTSATTLNVSFQKTAGLAGRIDLFLTTPTNYSSLSTNSTTNATFTASSTAAISLTTSTLQAGTYYIRVRHNAVTSTSWRTPYTLRVGTGTIRLANNEQDELIGQPYTVEVPLFTTYPNPANDLTNVAFQLTHAQKVKVNLVNMMGQVVKNVYENTPESEEVVKVALELENVPTGVYFLQLSGEGVSEQIRFVKQ